MTLDADCVWRNAVVGSRRSLWVCFACGSFHDRPFSAGPAGRMRFSATPLARICRCSVELPPIECEALAENTIRGEAAAENSIVGEAAAEDGENAFAITASADSPSS